MVLSVTALRDGTSSSPQRFAARPGAWPPAWPSPSGPQGRQRLRRSRVGPEDVFCGAVCAERLESNFGCPGRWRGRSVQCAAFRPMPGTFRPATGAPGRETTGPASSRSAGTHGALWRGACCGEVRGIGAAGSGPRRCAIALEAAGEAARHLRRESPSPLGRCGATSLIVHALRARPAHPP
jgi:hypothetical protein